MSLMQTFGVIKSNFKLKPQEYVIDNWVFKLHYRATVLFFLVSTILVTSRQYIGEHIRCIADAGVPEHVMNTFCFFTTTFTVFYTNVSDDALDRLNNKVKDLNADLLDSGNLAHPGVGPYGMNSTEPIKRHAYYQWVPFVLFFQAIMFYLTHLLWKQMEGGRLRYLVEGLKLAAFALEEQEINGNGVKIPSKAHRVDKIQQIRNVFMQGIYINKSWARKLILCELLNFLNVFLQIYITDTFLSGNFLSLGTHVWNEGFDSNVDILDAVFPKITKCTFHKYGPSGSIQYHDAMCVMALNIINDKIYTALWFWFIMLLVCSGLGLIWRMLTICLHSKSRTFNRLVFFNSCPGRLNPWQTLSVNNHRNYTDWLFLVYLAKNVDPMVFKEIVQGIAEDLEEKNSLEVHLIDNEEDSLS